MTDTRHVHLRAAIGKIRTATYNGRDHVVMPVTALVEGVLHAVNSPIPELVLAEEFGIAATSWNGRPVMMDHPEVRGQKVSANDPRILEQYAFGQVFNTHVEDGRLMMEAWFDSSRAEALGGDAVRTLERVKNADPKDPIEVSVGVFMVAEQSKGTRNGKPYQAIWRHITPDHLAVLPEGKTGACSVKMGCGIRHASVYLATAEGYEEVKMSLLERVRSLFGAEKSPTDDELRTAMEVENTPVPDDEQITAAEGCKCHEGAADMNKVERIKALMSHPHNPVKDEKILTAASDDVLKTLEEHTEKLDAADKVAADLKKAEEAAAAATKEVTEMKTAAAKELTEEEFMKAAPVSLRTMLEKHKAADVAAHSSLVAKLKTAQHVVTEDALKLKTLEQLQEIAALLKVDQPVDYALRVPRAAESTTVDYKSQPPPDGYAEALAKRKAATH